VICKHLETAVADRGPRSSATVAATLGAPPLGAVDRAARRGGLWGWLPTSLAALVACGIARRSRCRPGSPTVHFSRPPRCSTGWSAPCRSGYGCADPATTWSRFGSPIDARHQRPWIVDQTAPRGATERSRISSRGPGHGANRIASRCGNSRESRRRRSSCPAKWSGPLQSSGHPRRLRSRNARNDRRYSTSRARERLQWAAQRGPGRRP